MKRVVFVLILVACELVSANGGTMSATCVGRVWQGMPDKGNSICQCPFLGDC